LVPIFAAVLWTTSTRAQDCAALTPPAHAAGTGHDVTAGDLLELRDIAPGDGPISVSHDGRAVAFQLRRADPTLNRYCLGIYVVALGRGHPWVRLDSGGDYMLDETPIGDKPAVPIGPQTAVSPRWSPDDRWVAYLRRDNGSTQLWRARTDGSGAQTLTHGLADIADFAWGPDGHTLLVETRPGMSRTNAAIDREGLTGWHLDDRAEMGIGSRPLVVDTAPPTVEILDPADGTVRPAGPAEREWFLRQAASSSTGRDPGQDAAHAPSAWAAINPLQPEEGRLWAARGDAEPCGARLPCAEGRS
jgi:hypothetical protein